MVGWTDTAASTLSTFHRPPKKCAVILSSSHEMRSSKVSLPFPKKPLFGEQGIFLLNETTSNVIASKFVGGASNEWKPHVHIMLMSNFPQVNQLQSTRSLLGKHSKSMFADAKKNKYWHNDASRMASNFTLCISLVRECFRFRSPQKPKLFVFFFSNRPRKLSVYPSVRQSCKINHQRSKQLSPVCWDQSPSTHLIQQKERKFMVTATQNFTLIMHANCIRLHGAQV